MMGILWWTVAQLSWGKEPSGIIWAVTQLNLVTEIDGKKLLGKMSCSMTQTNH